MANVAWSDRGLHVIAKPIGAACNLKCEYCFYLEKASLYDGRPQRMTSATLREFVTQYIEAQSRRSDQIDFSFQGGEPTLVGVDFFREVVALQRELRPPGKRVTNALQTNGILLDDAWCGFLRDHDFLVGVSIDGPADVHDRYRKDRAGRGTHRRVVESIRCMQRHGVEWNALVCVHRASAAGPRRVYDFFRRLGAQHLQFIPVVERVGDDAPGGSVSDRSVEPEQFGRFLCEIFDHWVRRDVGRIFIRDFDQALFSVAGKGATLCVYAEQCGRAVALEHNGDLYACDHFVDAAHRLGNIHERSIEEMVDGHVQQEFGVDKAAALPSQCGRCAVVSMCRGGCPKDRISVASDGEPGLNYLCAGYQMFFEHVRPWLEAMWREVRAGRPAATIMEDIRVAEGRGPAAPERPGRNDPCYCGSGRKFKHCCWRRG